MAFERDLGGGITLALRTPEMARRVHDVAAVNIARLRQWEPWAHSFDPHGADDEWSSQLLRRFIDGTAIPTVVLRDGMPIGSVSAQLDRYSATAELGYWVAADAEGTLRSALPVGDARHDVAVFGLLAGF